MSRLHARFVALQAAQRKALVPYVTAGDPDPAVTVPLMHAMVEAGADVLELGVPFSDPMADGPVIQKATERALLYHVSLHDVLDMVRQFRSKDNETPVVLMGYLNPVEIMGYENFASQAASAGVDGVLTVDLPPEEADELLASLKKHELDPIFLLSPTSSSGRISQICAAASGFVYYVSLKGVTGAANLDVAAVAGKLQEIRQHTGLPLGVGFGIKDAETAAAVASVADAVVVGSAVVKLMEAAAGDTQAIIRDVCKLLSGMRQAMDK